MRDCENCARCGRDGCKAWDCDFVPRAEAIKAWKEKQERKDEPQTYVINPQEPTNDDKCFECDDFFTCGGQCNKIEDEPQTERKCIDCKFLTYMFGKTWCNIKCENPHDEVCDRFKPKDEPQTEIKGSKRLLKGSDEPQTVETMGEDVPMEYFENGGTWTDCAWK